MGFLVIPYQKPFSLGLPGSFGSFQPCYFSRGDLPSFYSLIYFMANTIKKIVTFCRRIKSSGIYTGTVKVRGVDQVIRLVDRQLITPTDPEIIKFLYADPEIEILCADEDEQKDENDRSEDKDK